MHEYSIIQSLIATCGRVAREHDVKKIVKIYITVGRMSGVDPHFLETSYRFFREETVCEHAEMVVEIEETEAECQDCRKLFPVKDFRFDCPECGSTKSRVTRGKTLQVTHIEAE
ncbi:hydrogenase maturation nickel metallochaperone HypA [Desulfocapsa sp. AH-315-G09]|uniref:Hydrogenase maturation factor HypA n=1 Tax=Desulfotalea psychrophila TaxID=84980 RepID=A0ABS3AW28_9BACT|nr:hydrogenase maturation nickel metallochaperone HypA [Desulfocapsa sp.]MBN4048574.1 hydrogenase maturation nickel metallochaperone HypA [bacterium AH-315-N22]MBN4065180.1 hydrogenase maturation nickel metallochaperone HypA [Desulfocapsa sp. AH-315-G09]MBN4068988.1 hydrogenase maturation nickel metallochaperone HypA [Desulfotalea psychrophila]